MPTALTAAVTAATFVALYAVAATARLARVLDHLVEACGGPDVPLSQPELASLVGVSAPTLHRAMADLRACGIVRTEYRRVVVSDLPALRALGDAIA